MYLMIDNYDSFVYNLACYLEECGEKVLLIRNDKITLYKPKALLYYLQRATKYRRKLCAAKILTAAAPEGIYILNKSLILFRIGRFSCAFDKNVL